MICLIYSSIKGSPTSFLFSYEGLSFIVIRATFPGSKNSITVSSRREKLDCQICSQSGGFLFMLFFRFRCIFEQQLISLMATSATNVYIEQQAKPEDIQDLGKGVGISIGVMALVIGCFNCAFIVPDLIFAYEGSMCVLSPVEGFSFNLSVWLQVDAYTRIGIVVLLFIVAIISCISLEKGAKMGICALCIIMLYSMFALAWTIVGSVMFWGKLNPSGVCFGRVRAYMYALLIISYIGTCCNCLYSLGSGRRQGETTTND